MELGHLLTRSGLTYPEAWQVSHVIGAICNSVTALSFAILHTLSPSPGSRSMIIVINPQMYMYWVPRQGTYLAFL